MHLNEGRKAIKFKESIGKVHKQRGEYIDAAEIFRESLSFYRNTSMQKQIATTLLQLGIILEQQAVYSLSEAAPKERESLLRDALKMYKEAYQAFKNTNDKKSEAQTLHLLGRIFRQMNQFHRAEEKLFESIRLKQELADPVRVAISEHELARLRGQQGNIKEAKQLYEKSITTLTMHGADKDAANAKWRYGQLLSSEQDFFEDAHRFISEAVEAYRLQGRWVKLNLANRDLIRIETEIKQLNQMQSSKTDSDDQ